MIPDYAALWASMTIPADRLAEIEAQADAIVAHQADYEKVGMGVPWTVVGVIHHREASGNFRCHLHNGDPLTARTTHVPAGRPLVGRPPFSWVLSAQDALMLEGWGPGDWSTPEALRRCEAYNGWGYRARGLLSPYVWAGTNHQQPGKFTADGHFDAAWVDEQLGVAPALKVLAALGFPLD